MVLNPARGENQSLGLRNRGVRITGIFFYLIPLVWRLRRFLEKIGLSGLYRGKRMAYMADRIVMIKHDTLINEVEFSVELC